MDNNVIFTKAIPIKSKFIKSKFEVIKPMYCVQRVEVLKLENISAVECMATQKAYSMSNEYTLPLFLPNLMEKAIKVLSYKNELTDYLY